VVVLPLKSVAEWMVPGEAASFAVLQGGATARL
jgi:hypothetical protein